MLTFFLEMPQNSNSSNFGTFSVLNPITCLFLKMSHFQCAFFLAMPHCSHLILHMGKCGIYRKNILPIGYWGGGGYFEKKARDHVQNRKGTEIETIRILGHFKEKSKFHHMKKFFHRLFTGFLFKVYPATRFDLGTIKCSNTFSSTHLALFFIIAKIRFKFFVHQYV